jgi:ferredoxin
MLRVTFVTLERTVDADVGDTLFDIGGRINAGIQTACVGKGTCGLCRVKVLTGNDGLTPFTDEETRHLGNVFHINKVRLACRARIVQAAADAEITVDVVPKRNKKK